MKNRPLFKHATEFGEKAHALARTKSGCLKSLQKKLSDLRVHLGGLCVRIPLNAENAETYAEFAEILIPHIMDENR